MTDKKRAYQRIGASLQYGIVFTRKWIIPISIALSILIGSIVALIIYLILMIVGVCEYVVSEVESIYAAIAACFCLSCVYIIPLCVKLSLKKKIMKWLDDAVELEAQTESLSGNRFDALFDGTLLQVEFYYNKILRRTSVRPEKKEHWWCAKKGHFKVLNKYANRKVKIFYSPSYDQVLILKDRLL